MPARIVILLFALMMARSASAAIGWVGTENLQCDRVTLSANLNSLWVASPKDGQSTYKVGKYPDDRRNALIHVKSSNEPKIVVDGLSPGTQYIFFMEVFARRSSGWLQTRSYKALSDAAFTTPPCSSYQPVPGDVRLRHEATGKCIYGNANDGGMAGTWGCWKDPAMAFALELVAANEYRLRNRLTGKCLFGNPVQGKEVKNHTCWADPNMVFVRENLGSSRVRFRHKATGHCIYTGVANGDQVKNWPCWDDPAMVWIVDPF